MQHITDDDLILRYYEETVGTGDDHLTSCPECRDRYQALQRVLNVVDVPVPYRSAHYESEVWSRLAPKLGAGRRWSWFSPRKWVAVSAMALVVALAFVSGRFLPGGDEPSSSVPARERVLVVAVGEHLERSQMVLAELVNAEPSSETVSIEGERSLAEKLLSANRLYRTAAAVNGDLATASLLDDLERVLLEVVHSPDAISSRELQALRDHVERQGLLFKIRVVGSQIRRESPETVPVSEKL